MKIGAFSRYFSVSQQTIRFYINKGLLCPIVKNDRYDFTDTDVEDMKLLLRLKSFRFSLNDIHRLLSLKRLSDFDDPHELDDYVHALSEQKRNLLAEKNKINGIIGVLQNEINTASGKHPKNLSHKNGIPLTFLEYLACPTCGGALSLRECSIEDKQILFGKFDCQCGFSASVKNGILIGPSGKISQYDWPDLERNCYRFMNPTLVSYMQKSYHWIIDKLHSCMKDGSLVLEDFINNYCFCHANLEDMNPNARYIITDKYPEIVAIYKGLIDRLGLDRQILYIAASSDMLPLKKGCVDVYIDFDSANEYALYNKGYSLDATGKYLKSDSYAVGAFFSFMPGSSSIKELHKQFPEAWDKCYDKRYFKKWLLSTWREIISEEAIGNVIDDEIDEKAILYHIPGTVEMDVYFAHGFNGFYDKSVFFNASVMGHRH